MRNRNQLLISDPMSFWNSNLWVPFVPVIYIATFADIGISQVLITLYATKLEYVPSMTSLVD